MLKHKDVQEKLGDVRRTILPKMPDGTVGYVFVSRGRALGAELFGSEELARDLLPKLLDSYAVDYVILHKPAGDALPRPTTARPSTSSSGCAASGASGPVHPAPGPASARGPTACWATA